MLDETKYDSGAGGLVDKVEEDEYVVEQVSKDWSQDIIILEDFHQQKSNYSSFP